MPGVIKPFGLEPIGLARLGDGLISSTFIHGRAIAVTYTIAISKYSAPLAITYTIQRDNTAPLLLYYLIGPIQDFAINGNASIVSPDRVSYTLRPVAGRTVLGGPTLQGLTTVTWFYSVLSWSEFSAIIIYYQPQNSVVTLTYLDESTTWVQRSAVMHPPVYGTMTTLLVTDVSLSFSILHS